ncbi:MAG: hypothetical protein ACT4PW_00755 [Acidimicrobiia bacterium]
MASSDRRPPRHPIVAAAAMAVMVLASCAKGNDPRAGVGALSSPPPSSASSAPPATASSPPTSVGPVLKASSAVTINGIGPVREGMTVADATKAAGVELVAVVGADPTNTVCTYVRPAPGSGLENDLAFMVSEGTIARVDVTGSRVATVSGIKVGSTEAQVLSTYPEQIAVTPHPYTGPAGHYLTFVPQDPVDGGYRVVFETDGQKVTEYHAGRLPEVEYIEGCS